MYGFPLILYCFDMILYWFYIVLTWFYLILYSVYMILFECQARKREQPQNHQLFAGDQKTIKTLSADYPRIIRGSGGQRHGHRSRHCRCCCRCCQNVKERFSGSSNLTCKTIWFYMVFDWLFIWFYFDVLLISHVFYMVFMWFYIVFIWFYMVFLWLWCWWWLSLPGVRRVCAVYIYSKKCLVCDRVCAVYIYI